MHSTTKRMLLLVTTVIAVAACNKAEHAGGPVPAPAPSQKDFNKTQVDSDPANAPTPVSADTIFTTRCATCHGTTGKGDGPASAALNPKPRNYTDPEWQKTVSDEHIKKTIVEGGAAVGKSPLMVPNPDLAGKEIVLDGLVKIIRGFAGK